VPQFGFEFFRQAHHPVEHGEEAQDAGLAPVAVVRRIAGAPRKQVGCGEEREGVGVGRSGPRSALSLP
jgi:hypothetical protein